MRALDPVHAGSPGPPRTGSFSVRRLGERVAIVSAGSRLDERRAREFSRTVLRATADGARELVLDLSAVRHHAWSAVYALCELEAHLLEACCEPVVVAAEEHLVHDLETVGLERAWALRPSLPQALAELLARPVASSPARPLSRA
jgi:anti-anti-sigma regulatory factor